MKNTSLINGEYVFRRVTAFVGNYGSGKTEVAVNFALSLASLKPKFGISIVDLDIVNPYFRCREAREILEAAGIETVFPRGEFSWADLPIVLPEIKGLLERRDTNVVLDVGGDDVGARVISSLSEFIDPADWDVLFVLNISRPFTEDVEGAVKIMGEVSRAGGIAITGIVANPHLTDETTPEVIDRGIGMSEDVSKRTGIPIRFVSVMKDVLEHSKGHLKGHPVLIMERRMLPPWKVCGEKIGPNRFKI